MEKLFRNFNELLEFDFTELEPQKSNYLGVPLSNGLPKRKIKEGWRTKGKSHDLVPKVIFEISPRWVTITIRGGEGKSIKEKDIECLKKNPKVIIQEELDL